MEVIGIVHFYTDHARDRMDEPLITAYEVEQTLAHPYRREVSNRTGNIVYYGRVNGRPITVVLAEGSDPPRIVTVWD